MTSRTSDTSSEVDLIDIADRRFILYLSSKEIRRRVGELADELGRYLPAIYAAES